ncbi:MAG: DUF6679 family protein [Cyanobacteria bacterium J06642_2]
MLERKIYQLAREGKEVWIFLRDRGSWLERVRILDIEGDIVLVRHETEDEDEICAWEEMVRLDAISAIAQRLSTIPKHAQTPGDLLVSDDCPKVEMLDAELEAKIEAAAIEADAHPDGRSDSAGGDANSEEVQSGLPTQLDDSTDS